MGEAQTKWGINRQTELDKYTDAVIEKEWKVQGLKRPVIAFLTGWRNVTRLIVYK